MKNIFLNISGPSGIGKTTTIKALTDIAVRHGLQLALPVKVTTRAPKPADNHAEMTFVSQQEYDALDASGTLVVTYTDHGHCYGLLRTSLTAAPGTTLIQSLPLRISQQLKLADELPVKVVTIRLTADAAVVQQRLTSRQDQIDPAERASRQRSMHKPVPDGADHYLDADRPALAVANDLALLIRRLQGAERISAPAPSR